MNEPRQETGIDLTRERFPEGIHICMIFDRDEDRQKIVSEYLTAGLRQGELVRYAVDVTTPEQVRSWLLELGVELPPEGGPFSVFKAENFYCPNGRFEPREMIDGMLPRFEKFREAGYSGVRSCGEMTWAFKGIPGSDRLLEYEALLNTVAGTFPHTGMCLYDARLFDGATLFKVLQVHPWMIVRGKIIQNPYFISPQEFIKESKSKQ